MEHPVCSADAIVCRGLKRILEWGGEWLEAFKGSRVLVTGGAGFIGSWLVDTLYAAGASRITIIDNLSTGDEGNVKHLLATGKVRLVRKPVEEVEVDECYDYVFHLAARPAPDDYQKHPVETMLVSSEGTRRALEVARRCDARFFLASTSEVYGDPEIVPTPEDYWGRVNPIGPRSPYDEGKRYAEALTAAYVREYGVDARIARIFNTYGPRLDLRLGGYGRVVTKFILQALRGEPLTIHGDGRQTRSFLYITDLIDGIVRLVARDRVPHLVYNLGSDQEITILELALLVKKLTGSSSEIIHTPPRPDDPRRRRPDITRAREVLGWEPRVSLEEGLRETIEWVRARTGL